jgi:hypothetical protein
MKNRGFGELDLIELGFNRINIEEDDYYYAIDIGKMRFITHQTKKELKNKEFFTLIGLTNYEETRITNPRDFKDVVRIFG